MFRCLFVYLFICSFICLFVYFWFLVCLFLVFCIGLFVYWFLICLFGAVFVCLFICSFVCLFVYLFICLFIYLFIYLFICLFCLNVLKIAYLFVYLFMWLECAYLVLVLFVCLFACLFIYLFIYSFIFTAILAADAYVCQLFPRWDSSVNRMRWAMRSVDRCVCQGVTAPKRGHMMCPLTRADYGEDYQMWYTDDPRPLTDRVNWKPDILNELLERVELCSELKIITAILFRCGHQLP